MKVLLDADALIKLTKAGAKELVSAAFEVEIPDAVKTEVIDEGRAAGHADAIVIESNVREGRIRVLPSPTDPASTSTLQSAGDRAVLGASLTRSYAAVVTDDSLLLDHLKSHGVSATVPAGLLLAAGRRRRLSQAEVRDLLEALRPYISSEEYVTYVLTLEGRYPRK